MQRLEASLPRRLRGEDELKGKKGAEDETISEERKDHKKSDKKPGNPDDITDRTLEGDITESEDFQLSRALDLLRSLSVYKTLN
jgi:hypothetical protein